MTSPRRAARAAILLTALTVVLLPVYRGAVELPGLATVGRGFAAATAGVLELAGVAVHRGGAVLRHPNGFAIEVAANCTAWLHVVIYLAGLATLRPSSRRGLAAGLSGVAVLAGVNVGRLVLVYVVGSSSAEAFFWTHRVVGEAVLAGTVLGLWRRAASLLWSATGRTIESSPVSAGGVA